MGNTDAQPLQGMSDISGPEVLLWQWMESRAREVFRLYGFEEVRTPLLERTEVFCRALGEGTDVVQKEMYAFQDRGGRNVALRPEGTAGVIRHWCSAGNPPDARLYYLGPMFRAERPQAGRKRQFHQMGVEAVGAPSPAADAECIALLVHLFQTWGLKDFDVRVHTRGTPEDQSAVREGFVASVRPQAGALCEECRRRIEVHPLRILDCKNEGCRKIAAALPPVTSYMSESSRAYLQNVLRLLDRMGVPARMDSSLIRGLDYYAHTIWEITHAGLGAQDALAGGGRYRIDMTGRMVEGVGFAVGMERVILALQSAGTVPAHGDARCRVWLVSLGNAAVEANLSLLQHIRRMGVPCGMDLSGRSMKAQMRAADRSGAPLVVIRGDDELARGEVAVKHMRESREERISESEFRSRMAPSPAG